jgi:hypothetical protein
MVRSSSRYAGWALAFVLLCLPGAEFVTPSSADEQKTTSKDKLDEAKKDLDHGFQEMGKAIQKVMEPVEKAITEGSSKAADTVKKAVTKDKNEDKK